MILKDFLTETDYINFSVKNIKSLSEQLFKKDMADAEKIEKAYYYVEKETPHSGDIGEQKLTFKASDVLKYKHGICYAKSNLFAALLRGQEIPAGFCYQRLTLNDDNDDDGYAVHCLNAVWYNNHFMKLDARGGRSAVFSLTDPVTAFPLRSQFDEYFIPGIFARQPDEIIKLFSKCKTRSEFFRVIPDELKEKPDVI